MLYSKVGVLAFHLASVVLNICLLAIKATQSHSQEFLMREETPKSSRECGERCLPTQGSGAGKGAMPLSRKFLEFHSGRC